jgi:hypothetical protein
MNQAAYSALFRAINRYIGNLPPLVAREPWNVERQFQRTLALSRLQTNRWVADGLF